MKMWKRRRGGAKEQRQEERNLDVRAPCQWRCMTAGAALNSGCNLGSRREVTVSQVLTCRCQPCQHTKCRYLVWTSFFFFLHRVSLNSASFRHRPRHTTNSSPVHVKDGKTIMARRYCKTKIASIRKLFSNACCVAKSRGAATPASSPSWLATDRIVREREAKLLASGGSAMHQIRSEHHHLG